MICKAVQTSGPKQYSYQDVDIGRPSADCYEVFVRVSYASICGTDASVIDGSLLYYQNGKATYPIITGHEWCGIYDGQPVVGICVLGCDVSGCKYCDQDQLIRCPDRREVGVVNKDGGHSEWMIMPEWALLSIPEASPKYALAEPLAVVLHGLNRINLSKFSTILISGYGNIGKLCSQVLQQWGIRHDVYDPRFTGKSSYDCDLFIECSGHPSSLRHFSKNCGGTILAFGFEYEGKLGDFVANEINFISTLGSEKVDFEQAIEMLPHIDVDTSCEITLDQFGRAMEWSKSRKVILQCGDEV